MKKHKSIKQYIRKSFREWIEYINALLDTELEDGSFSPKNVNDIYSWFYEFRAPIKVVVETDRSGSDWSSGKILVYHVSDKANPFWVMEYSFEGTDFFLYTTSLNWNSVDRYDQRVTSNVVGEQAFQTIPYAGLAKVVENISYSLMLKGPCTYHDILNTVDSCSAGEMCLSSFDEISSECYVAIISCPFSGAELAQIYLNKIGRDSFTYDTAEVFSSSSSNVQMQPVLSSDFSLYESFIDKFNDMAEGRFFNLNTLSNTIRKLSDNTLWLDIYDSVSLRDIANFKWVEIGIIKPVDGTQPLFTVSILPNAFDFEVTLNRGQF